MADPLTILRGILLEGGTPNIEGDDYLLGRYKFNKNTPTAFKSSTGSNYSLGSVYFLHSNRSLNHGAYILAASRNNIQAVNFNDKKELLSYLDGGEITASIQFDSLPTSTPTMGGISTADDTITIPEGQQMDQDLQKLSDDTTSTQLPFGGSLTQKEQEQIEQQSQQQQQDLSTLQSSLPQQQQQQQDDDYNDQYQDMAIQEFDEFKSDQIKIDPLLIHDKELTAQQKKDKAIFADKIDTKKIKPESPLTVDTYIEQVRTKRKNASSEENKSSFIIADQEVTKAINNRENKSSDKVSVLQSSVSFANILTNYKKFKIEDEEEKRRKRPSSSSSSPNIKSSPNGSPSIIPSNLKNRTPIIIVPSTLTASISLYNVLEFLQQSFFRPTLEKKQEMASQNIMKPPMITFDRITTQKVTYEVIDNVKSLKPEDWYRVVAAFVQGEAWQFKDWKWSNPADLFANIRGFYVKFDDSNLPDVVKSWDVKVLHISKSKRHLDHTAQVEFWNAFDDFVNAKKSYLNH
ncbi:hypothetical protein RB653_002059 [Dictyostelium firmibasis]|uniref:Uncharacterized protein n=1 Tax=Dictyostelium firmibasis TaxID=79012 RepID=A0AAN7TW87_9MYCE